MAKPLRILDLFSGLNGWGDPFRDAGYEVFAIDIDRRFEADAYLDVGDVAAVLDALPWRPDIILASPPCDSFSTGSMGKMWEHGSHPAPKRSERHPGGHPIAVEGMRLVSATLRLVAVLQPATGSSRTPVGDSAASTYSLGSRARPSGIAASGSIGPSRPTSGASSHPGSSCHRRAATATPTMSQHPEAAGRARRAGSAARKRASSRENWRSGSASPWSESCSDPGSLERTIRASCQGHALPPTPPRS